MSPVALLFIALASAQASPTPLSSAEALASPMGLWRTIDDATGKASSIVRIWEESGELRGRIEKILPQPGVDPDPVCAKCSGDKQGKKVRGMVFLWGFKREAKGWSDGVILDPESGKEYHANLELQEGGKKLKVKGYIRVLFKIGRSQVWDRVGMEALGNSP